MSQEFIELVNSALFSNDNQQRQYAEKRLIDLKFQNLNEFILQSSQMFSNAQIPSQSRQGASTLLKRSIEIEQGWLKCSGETHSSVKQILIGQLIATDFQIVRGAANCIAAICAIELPRGEWADIVPTLVQNTNHENKEIKKAAILTLGYICESLKNQKQSISPPDAEKILYGICQSISQEASLDMKNIAFKALQDSLQFIEPLLQQQNVRDFVMNLLLTHCRSQTWSSTLRCMIDFCKVIFSHLHQYIHKLYEVLEQSIGGEEELAILSMEVWQVIAEEILERKSNKHRLKDEVGQQDLFNGIHGGLLQKLLQNLLRNQDDEEDESGVQEAAYKVTATLAEVVGQQSYPLFTVFVENTLSAQEWQKRKAGLLAFGAMIETEESNVLQGFCNSAIDTFFNKLNDNDARVVVAASRIIQKISENYPSSILQHTNCLSYFEIIFQFINNKKNTAKNLVTALTFLTETLRNQNSPIKGFLQNIVQQLTTITTRQDIEESESAIIDLAWVSILNLMYCIDDYNLIYNYLEEFGNQLQNTSQLSKWRREVMQTGLLAAIHAAFLKLVSVSSNPPSQQLVTKFYQLITDLFKQQQSVNSDGIYAISAIAQASKKHFQSLSNDFITQYIQFTLTQTQEPQLLKTGIVSLADIARSLMEGFTPYLQIMEHLISLLNNPSIIRDIKVLIFMCITDIILATGMASEKYAQQVITLIQAGFQMGIQMAVAKDPTQQEYFESLNETLVNCFICLLHSYNGPRPYMPLFDTLPQLIQFIQYTSDKSLSPTVDYIKLCVSCLLDFISYYKIVPGKQELILQVLNSQVLCVLLETLKSFKQNQEIYDTLLYAKDQYKVFNIKFEVD